MTSKETLQKPLSLFESLQKEFCPTLDSSLIASLLFEVESDVDGNPVTPSMDQLESLRGMLKELFLQADECSKFEYMSDMDNDLLEISSWTVPSSNHDNSNSEYLTSVSPSSSSSMSFTPLGFLQMVLPDIPSANLKKALDEYDGEDLWDIIAVIVAEESTRETEERGLKGSECNDDAGWEVVQKKRKETGTTKVAKKKTPIKPKKFVLTDVRQQHHEQNLEQKYSHGRNRSASGVSSQSLPSIVDPWTRIASLSSRLASLLPPHSSTTFSSFLHSPRYASSYDAVRGCLASLSKSNELSDQQATLLINLLDIISPEDDELDIEMRSKIISDVELAVYVTEGRADDALDLAHLLRDLDIPHGVGLNSFHSQLSPSATPKPQGSPPSLSIDASDVSSLESSLPSQGQAQATHLSSKRSYQWQTVSSRTKTTQSVPRYLGPYIPTYSRDVNGRKIARGGFPNRSIYSSAPEEEANLNTRLRVRQAMAKSRQALMDAAIMYRKHNARNRGGEVAFFYAERAREWKKIANREALNAAREMVLAKSEQNGKRDVVDLHGTTVAEALAIIREILNQRTDSISSGSRPILLAPALFNLVSWQLLHITGKLEKPLRIITGKGNHSAGRVGVLKPALLRALTEDGWLVTSWDAGLVVRGARF